MFFLFSWLFCFWVFYTFTQCLKGNTYARARRAPLRHCASCIATFFPLLPTRYRLSRGGFRSLLTSFVVACPPFPPNRRYWRAGGAIIAKGKCTRSPVALMRTAIEPRLPLQYVPTSERYYCPSHFHTIPNAATRNCTQALYSSTSRRCRIFNASAKSSINSSNVICLLPSFILIY